MNGKAQDPSHLKFPWIEKEPLTPTLSPQERKEGADFSLGRNRVRKEDLPMNKIDLDGRTAVVTGGAQGFGRAITERFVASGARVAIWDNDHALADKTAHEIGNAVSAFKVDVTDNAAVAKARDETLRAFGKIDILVNNA